MKSLTKVLILSIGTNFLSAQRYGAINARLDKILEERTVEKGVIDANLEGKKFIIVKSDNTSVIKKIIQFEDNNKITIIEVSTDAKTDTDTSKIYTGDVVKNDNYISIRADKLEGKAISLPYTYNFLLQKKRNSLYMVNINNNERWLDTNP